jgi:methylthioribose-1-phosphate isomerase
VNIVQAVQWSDDGRAVRIVDQRALPQNLIERDLRTIDEICDAIRTLAVRGAPAIGVAAAMGLVAALQNDGLTDHADLLARVGAYAGRIRSARPTAVNLPRAIDRMVERALASSGSVSDVLEALRREAEMIRGEDRAMCRRIGEHALPLFPLDARVLTHCNAGALATSGIGTALAPVYLAAERGDQIEVYVGETRPLLQGSRLTAWELARAGIPVTVVVDGAVASLMRAGEVDLCIVGADRIAANGDVANKVGTYALAIAAKHHDIPFYVAAPSSTFDPSTPNGDAILVERRAGDEIARGFGGAVTAPPEACIENPAFDITPASLITAIISDRGVHEPPFRFVSDT